MSELTIEVGRVYTIEERNEIEKLVRCEFVYIGVNQYTLLSFKEAE